VGADGSSASGDRQPVAEERPVRASASYQTISLEVEARHLAERLMNDTRSRAAIVITTRPSQTQPWIDPDEVRNEVGDGPEILFIATDRAQHQFVRSMPHGHGLECSNARVYWPNLTLMGDGRRHPLIRDNLPDPVGRLREGYISGPKFDLDNPGGKVERKPSELSYVDRVAALLGANAKLTTERDQAKARAARLDRKLKGQPDRRSRQAERDGATAEPDVDREFRELIFDMWLNMHTARERPAFPLRRFRIGRRFLDSVKTLPPDAARRVPRVSTVVLCGRAHEVGDYEPHQIGAGTSSGSGVLRRSNDGAVAMRCRIGGSHRLHWWAGDDTSVDLAIVVHADSHDIPED
jgi:hypothetical protein